MQKIKDERLRTLFLEIYRHIYHHNDLFVKKNVRTQIEVSSWSHVSERKGLLFYVFNFGHANTVLTRFGHAKYVLTVL